MYVNFVYTSKYNMSRCTNMPNMNIVCDPEGGKCIFRHCHRPRGKINLILNKKINNAHYSGSYPDQNPRRGGGGGGGGGSTF